MLISLDFTTLVANTIERLSGSDGSPYEKRVDAKGRVLSDKCISDEVPFERLPEGWAWARLSMLTANVHYGYTCSSSSSGHIKLLRITDIQNGHVNWNTVPYCASDPKDYSTYFLKEGDILIARTGGTIGKSFFISEKPPVSAFASYLIRAIPIKNEIVPYFRSYFDSPSYWAQLIDASAGTGQPNVNATSIGRLLIALPPLAEQRRIVERVSELMPLVEEYGGLEDAREALDAALPGRLRKSVLQLAVQGGLVPQDPADEPAGVLLERIRGQRRQLVAEGKMRAPKGGESIIFAGSDGRRYEKRVDARGRESEPVCIEDEIPFEIPEGWEWARLSSIASFGGGKTPPTNDRSNFTKGGVLWVTSKDMKQDHISGTIITLSDKGASGLTIYPRSSLIMVTRSGILRRLLPVAILDKPATVNQDQKVIVPDNDSFSEWLLRYFQASDLRIRSKYGKDGTTVESVIFDKVKEILVPIPSLAEQRRVIAHLEELMALTTN